MELQLCVGAETFKRPLLLPLCVAYTPGKKGNKRGIELANKALPVRAREVV